MSTNGTFGFVIDGERKLSYNHCDSYPGGLGLDVLGWLRNAMVTHPGVLPHQARALRVVDGDSEPTDEEFEQLKEFYNPNVGGRSARPTWYQLLRETQGDPAAILKAGVMENGSNYVGIEYEYLVDFDASEFVARDTYSNLTIRWALTDLPTDEAFIAVFQEDAE